MARIIEELVYATAEDGLEHAGVLVRPARAGRNRVPLLLVHGAGANFTMPAYVRLAHALAQRGYTTLIGNNRGHDFGYFIGFAGGRPRYAGQGWELFDQSPRDIAGWLALLERRGSAQAFLIGHSLGAAKVVFYQAQRHDPRVLGVVSASAPAGLARDSALAPLRAVAGEMLRDGRGQDLLPWGSVPGGGTLSAQTYLNRAASQLDIYGLDTPAPLITTLGCPLLALYGSEETPVGGASDLARAREHADPRFGVETCLIDGADHVYTGREAEVARTITVWAGKVAGAALNRPAE